MARRREGFNVHLLPPLNKACSIAGCEAMAVTELRFRDFDSPTAVDEALLHDDERDLFLCTAHYRQVMTVAASAVFDDDPASDEP